MGTNCREVCDEIELERRDCRFYAHNARIPLQSKLELEGSAAYIQHATDRSAYWGYAMELSVFIKWVRFIAPKTLMAGNTGTHWFRHAKYRALSARSGLANLLQKSGLQRGGFSTNLLVPPPNSWQR